MRIAVMDGHALNPGDIDWTPIAALAEPGGFTAYDRTPADLVLQRIGEAEAVFTNKVRMDRAVISGAPRLRYIGVLATGYDVVDLVAAKERGIVVTNIPGYATEAVAQYVFALLLEMASRVGEHDACVHRGEWEASPDFSFFRQPLVELSGKTMGIVGYGTIGKRVAHIAKAFGMRVLAARSGPFEADGVAEPAAFERLLAESDVVSLHCPLTDRTRGLMDRAAFARMKDGAMLVNTARGPVVVEEDLAAALRSGKLAAAAVDVLSREPAQPGNPLLSAPNCYITPHVAWAPRETRERLLGIAAGNLSAFVAGKPVHVVG